MAALAQAQTFTACNPMEKDCPNDPAIAANFETDFRQGADKVKGWKQTAGKLTYTPEGALFTVAKQGDSPTIQTEGYLHFGYVEVKVKAAPGQGIVSSIVVQSEDLDEIDWEFIGGVPNEVQLNYFGKGNTTDYTRGSKTILPGSHEQIHTYALNWTSSSLTWIIDNKVIRTLNYADALGGKNYPQTPSNVRIGIWAGGDPTNEKGVIEWAGGRTDYSKGPYSMLVQSVKVINYNPGKEYDWTDRSGSFQSIKVIEPGNKAGAPQNSVVIQPSATASGPGVGSGINIPTGKPGHNGTSPGGPGGCNCGVATVTVTGQPPASTVPAPPASSGILIETKPQPSVPVPTNPTGNLPIPVPTPTRNATISAPPSQFTGAASLNQAAGAMFGVVAGAVMLAL